MDTNTALLLALVVALVIALLYQNRKWFQKEWDTHHHAAGFVGTPAYISSPARDASNAMIAATRDHKFNQPKIVKAIMNNPTEFALASKIAAAERELHTPATSGAAMDYQSHVSDLVLDSKASASHRAWAKDAQSSSSVVSRRHDNMDEAVANSVPFVGHNRPQAVAQSGTQPTVTELGPRDFIHNKRMVYV